MALDSLIKTESKQYHCTSCRRIRRSNGEHDHGNGKYLHSFAKQYAEAKDVAVSAVWGLVMGTVTASGIPEAIAAAILVLAIGKVLIGVFRKINIGNV